MKKMYLLGSTCCPLTGGGYGCCPLGKLIELLIDFSIEAAVCCSKSNFVFEEEKNKMI
jgi:hypothetical protein